MNDLISISDARANLPEIVTKVSDNLSRVTITVNGKPKSSSGECGRVGISRGDSRSAGRFLILKKTLKRVENRLKGENSFLYPN